MPFVIIDACIDVKDKTCVSQCPVDCIYEGGRKMYIHPDECIECGACEPVCPVNAIFAMEDVPADQEPHIASNSLFFEGLGSPGGAEIIGPQDRDHIPDLGDRW
ncbi:ferredoxin [Streptosporangium sp. CA-115845]|uniref:ferredoxin n=1 Tax=Streptosporangium sp. CA-115845 TaxID=3240071 RepID=UPI003D8E8A9A